MEMLSWRTTRFDILLDVLLVNQTFETLQNLSVEFATLGDLKVVERPTTQNLSAHDFFNVQSTIKVSSTDTGVIFGNVIYSSSSTESNVVSKCFRSKSLLINTII